MNGLTGKEYNLVDDTKPTSEKITVNPNQPQIALCDPDHGTAGTSIKIFGTAAAAAYVPGCFVFAVWLLAPYSLR